MKRIGSANGENCSIPSRIAWIQSIWTRQTSFYYKKEHINSETTTQGSKGKITAAEVKQVLKRKILKHTTSGRFAYKAYKALT